MLSFAFSCAPKPDPILASVFPSVDNTTGAVVGGRDARDEEDDIGDDDDRRTSDEEADDGVFDCFAVLISPGEAMYHTLYQSTHTCIRTKGKGGGGASEKRNAMDRLRPE